MLYFGPRPRLCLARLFETLAQSFRLCRGEHIYPFLDCGPFYSHIPSDYLTVIMCQMTRASNTEPLMRMAAGDVVPN
jgi:hypothetical protein